MGTADEGLRREIGSERQELALAVDSLRGEVRRAKRRLPKIVAGVVAAVVVLKLVRRRLRGRR
jgi:hypothetical protein